jgi:hypothetical protein
MSTVYARKAQMLVYLQTGYLPSELADDAMLACEEKPPAWRPFKRKRWEAAVVRINAFAIMRARR